MLEGAGNKKLSMVEVEVLVADMISPCIPYMDILCILMNNSYSD